MPGFGMRIHAPRDDGAGSASGPAGPGNEDDLVIRAPATSRLDERIPVRVAGAPPGAQVSLRAELVDGEGVTWRAGATVTADEDGVVDLTEQAPDAGDWDAVAPMGWCWAMTSDADARLPRFADASAVDVTLDAGTEVGDAPSERDQRARRTITRQLYDPGIEARAVDADGLVGTWYEPSGAGPHPGVVSLHGSAGPGSHRLERLLATRGFATLALAYAGDDPAVPDRIREVPLPSLHEALAWFGERPAVADGSLGLFGVSRGAELALLVGARSDLVGPVVSYAGSGVRYDTPMGDPAWVDGEGEPVPHIEGVGDPERTADGQVVTRPVLEQGLDEADEATLRAATTAVEDIDGPVLLVSGGDDRVWPAQQLSAIAAERVTAAEDGGDCTHLTATDVGHLIGVPWVPLGNVDAGGGTPAATARLAARAWDATLETLAGGLPAIET